MELEKASVDEIVFVDDTRCVICSCVLNDDNRSETLKNVCVECAHSLES